MVDAMAEQSVREAMLAVKRRDEGLAWGVIERDTSIDQAEVEVEEKCLNILALHQPVAIDLRFIIAVLKINNDLERVGDLAVNIARESLCLVQQPEIDIVFDFSVMAVKIQTMLKRSLDALVNVNSSQARQVCSCDQEIDAMNQQVYRIVLQAVNHAPSHSRFLVHLLSIAGYLERIANHATNIAEHVIYMIEGKIVRHSP